MDQKGLLIVISGFSGAGKGTLVKELVDRYGYSLSISCTTRDPRPGEEDGVHYHFKTKEEFERLIDYNGFIEYAQYVENYYGTPRKFVEEQMAAGHNVILEIEVQGAINIKKQYPDAVTMFITAPSAEILKERLKGRGSEDEATIDKRMKRAVKEADSMPVYDYLVVNDDLETCIGEVQSIIVAESLKSKYKEGFMDEIKKELTDM